MAREEHAPTREADALAAVIAGFKHDGAYRKTVEEHAAIVLVHLREAGFDV